MALPPAGYGVHCRVPLDPLDAQAIRRQTIGVPPGRSGPWLHADLIGAFRRLHVDLAVLYGGGRAARPRRPAGSSGLSSDRPFRSACRRGRCPRGRSASAAQQNCQAHEREAHKYHDPVLRLHETTSYSRSVVSVRPSVTNSRPSSVSHTAPNSARCTRQKSAGPLRPHDEQCRAQRIGQRVIRRHDRH